MQLNGRKAKAGTAQLTRFLVPPGGNKPANDGTAADNIQMKGQMESRWSNVANWLANNPKVAFGLSIVGFFVLVAILGPLIIQHDPNAFSADVLQPPSAAHWLGTTQTGQDVFTQVIIGTRVSLFLGFVAGFLATMVSVIIGLMAGYFGGLIDDVLSLLMNIFLVVPALPLAVVLAAYFPFRGPLPVAIIVTLTGWAWGARVLRAQTLSMRRREFVEAARASGETTLRIIFVEILPNELAIIAAGLVGTIIYAVLAQAGLEFLGLGDVTVVSWGTMFYWAQNNEALLLGAWWWFLAPGFCVALLGAGLAFINFGIDELANPRLRRERRPRRDLSGAKRNAFQSSTPTADSLAQPVGASAERSEARFNPSRPWPIHRPHQER